MISKTQIFRIIFFLITLILLDQLAGYEMRKLYFTQRTGQLASLDYSLKECKADILIFGNSRAQHHYDSKILSEGLGMDCYNAGMDGGHSVLMQYAQIKTITDRYSPKIIILEFLPENLLHTNEAYYKLSILLPYYNDYVDLRSLILMRGPFERIKLLSAIYPFNSDILNIIRYNTNTHAARKKDYAGYVPIKNKVMNIGLLEPQPKIITQSVIDNNMVNALKKTIQICKNKNITLFIITSPIYHNINERRSPPSLESKLALEIIHNNNVNYIDYSFNSTFNGHMEMFADKIHLNDKGAKIFSNEIKGKIRNFKNLKGLSIN